MVAFELVDRGLQTNPGLCSVLENAACCSPAASWMSSRTLLEQGVGSDHDAMTSPLAWLARFDVLPRANDRAAFESDGASICRAVRAFRAGVEEG
jgi:hypothetical protein